MRIGIDASRAFVENPTGTERYSYEVITRILQLPEARKHEWILYTRNSPPAAADPSLKFSQARGFAVREGRGVSYKMRQISLPYLWTQIGLAWRTWTDNLDCLWVPAHTLPILRKPGIRTVVTIHGIEYEWLPAYENWLQRWYLPLSTQYAVRSATKIIAVSEFTKKQLIERLGADRNKINVVHEGVTNTSPSNPSPIIGEGRKGEVLTKWGLKSKQYLLFVGTVQPRKNLERLIQAYSALSTKHLALRLVIAGKLGWMYDDVVEMAKKHGVITTGYTSEAERYSLLGNALVYVQPSISEGFGLPVLEAMAAGVPVVSSNGGALAEVVGDAGVLFDPYDLSDIFDKLSLIVNSSKLRKELITKGHQRTKDFSWQMAAERTYNTLISKY
ncbi:MAG: AprM [Microgenomates group bacterium GW2011_GWC1_47_20]|uniref:Glycosyl transferase group 1 n=1 Tax=Candidatus Amesbacteria bacterium GW2011_GWC2_45_19 TaxID=1618366 RepID=A0A0G1M3D4_9BACT|nr:MAG: hypothetical protein UX05_C0008G0023 [Candidatus Amesbacteria bacterium GW2011_GWC2_45_19]KKU68472.1 MAG: AprM [Microgenomates group bacterium GW2011_GWC1_47_20]